jgi:hypothetical protein
MAVGESQGHEVVKDQATFCKPKGQRFETGGRIMAIARLLLEALAIAVAGLAMTWFLINVPVSG